MGGLIAILEKLLLGFTALSVVFVGGTVGLFSIMPPRSGIPDVAVNSELATMDWLDAQRARRSPQANAPQIRDFGTQVEVTETMAPSAQPKTVEEKKQVAVTAKSQYWGGNDPIPPSEQVKGIPWLRKIPGVVYAKPKKVPQILYQKYQSFEDSFALAKQGGGEFVETDSGPAYQVNWVNEGSHLYSRIGLRQGDKVISVNGQPVGKSPAAGRAMFEQMKNERQFSVLVERKKQQLVLSYTVGQ